MEKTLNSVLWALLLGFGLYMAAKYYQDHIQPHPFVQPSHSAPPLFKLAEQAPDGQSPWLAQHFPGLPLPAQGEAPAEWSELERSLDPASCGACHAKQYAEWKDSWHAHAMGPGMVGQLVDMDKPKQLRACQSCHAPLEEQQPVLADGTANPVAQEALRSTGVSCAACHVRGHTRSGPPKPDGSTATEPHGGFVAQAEFQDAEFCRTCHDFKPGQKGLNDKLFQETYAEWRHTEYAAQGVTCQSCHMPEGSHSFKGVHDPDMVRRAFTAEAQLTEPGDGLLTPMTATLQVTNTGAGHRFPTYTTPVVALVVEQLDAAGQVLEGTRQEGYVARKLKPDLTEERFDTRLMPGESFALLYSASRHGDAVSVRARVEVWPDEAYRINYEIWLRKPETRPNGAEMLREAMQSATDSRFVAWEQTLPLAAP